MGMFGAGGKVFETSINLWDFHKLSLTLKFYNQYPYPITTLIIFSFGRIFRKRLLDSTLFLLICLKILHFIL